MRINSRAMWAGLVPAVAVVIVLAIPASSVFAAGTLFVSPTGSDAGSCTAPHPCATISHAVSLAGVGATIIVNSGTYHDDVVITKRVSLLGQGNPTIDANGLQNGVFVQGGAASGSSLRGFTVKNANFEGVLIMQADRVQVAANSVLHNDQGMFATNPVGECAPQGPVPGDCGEGLHLMTSSGSQLIGNTVQDNSGGILLTDEFGPTANNQLIQNTITGNQFDCGITLASHSTKAVVKGQRQPDAGGVHDNLITGNTVNNNGVIGFGAGILMAAAGPGSGTWGNRVIGNVANDNGLPGVTIHSHAPNQDVNDNVIIGNQLSHDALTGNFGTPGDGDFGDTATTGILVASAVVPITGTQILGNQISNVHFGIFTQKVPVSTLLQASNSFSNVAVPVHQQ